MEKLSFGIEFNIFWGRYEFCPLCLTADGGYFECHILRVKWGLLKSSCLLGVERSFGTDRMAWSVQALWGLVNVGQS